MKKLERIFEGFFLMCAFVSVLSVAAIMLYIFIKGVPAIAQIGAFNFIFGKVWNPTENLYGIYPMIAGTVYVTTGAIAIGIPVGILTAVFISEIAPPWLEGIITPGVELLAGIPSIVYGFFGLTVIVPFVSEKFGGPGNSLLSAIIILSIMILPTIINLTKISIQAVSKKYLEASFALGASKIETIFCVQIPTAKSGIMSAVVLAIGRATGETMAVILVAGNSPVIPKSISSSFRALTANIALEMSYASGLHQSALFATGVVLFCFIMLLNTALNIITSKDGD